MRGDCSKKSVNKGSGGEENCYSDGPSVIEDTLRPKKVSFKFESPKRMEAQTIHNQEGLCVDLGFVEVCSSRDGLNLETTRSVKEKSVVDMEEEVLSSDSVGTKEEMVRATVTAEKKHAMGFAEAVDGCLLSDSVGTKEDLVRATVAAERDVAERRDWSLWMRRLSVWGVERAGLIQKARKKGIAESCSSSIYIILTRKSKARFPNSELVSIDVERQSMSDMLEVEVAKILETDNVLGFDFMGVEKEVVEALARRETEDEENFKVLNGELVGLKKKVVFCNIYEANVETERREQWAYICSVQFLFPLPWCLGGDFNTVLDPSERKCVGCSLGYIRHFNSFVLKANVVDLPLAGIPFT
ncbi:hypothetical protein Dsin_003387 [Dipteronia sinensis]|uniref:Uncharacterized protein n=1 Tax=Dipteronia sinensis TaxID=43782 RepID=A0AAE0B7K4_9ROSI|nr:hypothetical protein Dsin_003387 [Dipteronia sinensis]